MLDKYIEFMTAAFITVLVALLAVLIAILACFLHKELTSESQSNHPAKIEMCK